ncbi:alpha/beta fold hydrolase [Roseomonas sp. CCTCC AB2023176]|uniref:alpha/beta fold hydrolase n=1 Tax=Roseomonas sp. CCTCC AB2023176 TaxID=3342640 RepID=UPI0035E1A3AA
MVLLHGLFGQARNFGAIQKALAAERRVIALDLRNHGSSPHDARMDYPAMAADVAETLAARGIGAADVLGHSMGGKVAMALALTRPEVVSRLVVADIAPVAYPPTLGAYAEAMLRVPSGATRAEADAVLAEAVEKPSIRAFLLSNRLSDGSWRLGLAEVAVAMPAIQGWDLNRAPRYEGRTLFVCGDRSEYVGHEHREACRALFPNARFTTIRDAGHWVHADQPAAFVEVVRGFLNG